MRVAIIGAGAAGLTTARHLKDYLSEIDVYERRNTIGGVWRDRGETVYEDDPVAWSPIYDYLSTNTTVAATKFEDLEYEIDGFIPWREVNKYLKKYAEKFDLLQHILVQTEVVKISRMDNEWKLCSRHTPTGKLTEKRYTAIIVCAGHEEIPRTPQMEGAKSFRGVQLHSKKYRDPEHYRNQNVLIIGVGPSGTDIAMQITDTARKVYLSHHKPELLEAVFPENLIQKPDVKKITEDSVIFQDDSIESIDVIIYCTGYEYNYDYFDETCGVTLGDRYIKNLYKQMISIEHPTLIFCTIQRLFFIFFLAEQQAKFAAKVVSGKVKLPSKQEMLKDTEEWEQKNRLEGRNENQFYDLEGRSREYLKELSQVGSLPEPLEAMFDLFDQYYYDFEHIPAFFRKNNYRIVNSKFVYDKVA